MRTKTKTSQFVCGFCAHSGTHEKCPAGVPNGDGRIIRCTCGCPTSQGVRCTQCGNRHPDEVQNWKCIDPDQCASNTRAHLQNSGFYARADQAAERATHTPRTPQGKGGCLCCGEPTRGGKFRPGHDGRWVTQQVEAVRVHGENKTEVLARAQQVSPALATKIATRLKDRP